MRIEHFSDEHGIYVRASEEAFLVSKEQAASIRKYINELRELVRDIWSELDAATQYDAGGGRGIVYEFAARMKELGVDADA